jgi:hypothetical protein
MNPARQNRLSTGRSGLSPAGLLVLLFFVCTLCSCGRNSPKAAAPFQTAVDADPERTAENRIQQLLSRLNVRQNEVATLRRVASPDLAVEKRDQAVAARYATYAADKYITVLRAAQAAVQNKTAALTLERAILDNSPEAAHAATNRPSAATTNAPPDERTEEMNLKARLVDLQLLSQDLSQTGPPPERVTPQVREKAAAARDELYTADQYVESLGVAAQLLESKLRGLDAEAGFYEDALGLSSKPNGKH